MMTVLLFMQFSNILLNLYKYIIKDKLMNRHNWTNEQDSQLRVVVSQNGSEDWTRNAQILRLISHTAEQKKRTGKQCRQRWYNHLDPNVVKSQWKTQQQNKLFQMHKIHGNKWKQLTKYLPGRTDNDIKNHFYSTLRRSLRRLNKYTGEKNSTSQMRQIKPSVLTFIINHTYNNDNQIGQNKHLINSLKQLPQLIFKFSSFKPVKQNMDKKVDDNLRQRISVIMGLIDKFKQNYKVEKNQDIQKSSFQNQIKSNQRSKKNTKSKNNKINENQQSYSQEQQEDQIKQEHNENYMSILKQQLNSQDGKHDKVNMDIWNERSSSGKITKQFTPIVTIQRKPSNLDANQKQITKKIILLPKFQQIQKYEQRQKHIRALSFHDDDQMQNQLMPIEQPSLSMHQNSNIFGDLVVIGKHIEPIQCLATNEQQNFCEIDQILYQNYQK